MLKMRMSVGKGRETLEPLAQRCWEHLFLKPDVLLLALCGGDG